jgi:hypothetical protein
MAFAARMTALDGTHPEEDETIVIVGKEWHVWNPVA